MSQINLLKQSSSPNGNLQKLSKLFAIVFAALAVLLVGYYAWLFIDYSFIGSQIQKAQVQYNSDLQTALAMPQRSELITRQQQLKSFSDLLNSHQYWSQLLPALAAVTLKSASYSDLKVDNTGRVTIQVSVPTLDDLDKYLQVFDLPAVSKNFSNVAIGAYHKEQGKNSTSIQFQVMMDYNPALIQYAAQDPSATK